MIRRSPRLLAQTFPWESLDMDLQAFVLVQLARNCNDLIRRLAQLARHIRPLRPAILRALHLEPRLSAALTSRWEACVNKFSPSTSGLVCNWRDAHACGAINVVLDERVTTRLRLEWDAAPRRWLWRVHFAWHIGTPLGHRLCVASHEVVLSTATRVGMPPAKGLLRTHRIQRKAGGVCDAALLKMEWAGVCFCQRPFGRFDLTRVSTGKGVLRFTCGHELLFEWALPAEALSAMNLAAAFL